MALCSCGVVHVTVGGTTVRIRAEAAAQLRDVLGAALPQIEAEAKRPTLRLAPREGDLSS